MRTKYGICMEREEETAFWKDGGAHCAPLKSFWQSCPLKKGNSAVLSLHFHLFLLI